jgi:hypothetical protein
MIPGESRQIQCLFGSRFHRLVGRGASSTLMQEIATGCVFLNTI